MKQFCTYLHCKPDGTPETRAYLSASRKGISRHTFEGLKRMAAKIMKPVECVTLNTVFDSVKDAAKSTGLHPCCISRVCIGSRKNTGGLIFKFV